MYKVFDNGKPCSSYKISTWEVDTFPTKREAEIFAYHWAYPWDYQYCVDNAPEMDLDKDYDYTMGVGGRVLMKITEVE